MVNPIPTSVRKAWDEWNIRAVILVSLSMQAILVLCAPFRKRTANKFIIILVWLSYLFADWSASFAVGLISNNSGIGHNNNLVAFWAPFLLSHLGGPDTITAFALEDNELWLRHLVGLVFQLVATVYVFLLTLPKNKLMVPTFLMFLVGIIKYVERSRALYLASLDTFRESMLHEPDPGFNYDKLMDEFDSRKDAGLPTHLKIIHAPDTGSKGIPIASKKKDDDGLVCLDEIEVVERAYYFFEIFKGLIADLILSFRERDESREFFHKISPESALKVIEVELNFIYEVLYTKVAVVHNVVGYISRLVSFCLVVLVLGLFFSMEKHGFKKLDVRITYSLLIGSIALDALAFLMLIFSDWSIAALNKRKNKSSVLTIFDPIFEIFIKKKRSRWSTTERKFEKFLKSLKSLKFIKFLESHEFLEIKTSRWSDTESKDERLATPFLFRRWSESVPGCNLITYALQARPKKFFHNVTESSASISIYDVFLRTCDEVLRFWRICRKGVGDYLRARVTLIKWRRLPKEPVTTKLWKFIFEDLKEKSLEADDTETTKRICSARGAYVLEEGELKSNCDEDVLKRNCSNLTPYIENAAYDESILLWHVATEICYHNTKNGADSTLEEYREFSKLLSDYMVYLLVKQPTIISSVAGIDHVKIRDTCAEAEKFFTRKGIDQPEQKSQKSKDKESPKSKESQACASLRDVNTNIIPFQVKGGRSKSVLFDACKLAKELQKMGDNEKIGETAQWEIMSKVWVEMLSYAAIHCRADAHAQQVSKGGELITFVWLLMAHLGLQEKFQKNHVTAKLIVRK